MHESVQAALSKSTRVESSRELPKRFLELSKHPILVARFFSCTGKMTPASKGHDSETFVIQDNSLYLTSS